MTDFARADGRGDSEAAAKARKTPRWFIPGQAGRSPQPEWRCGASRRARAGSRELRDSFSRGGESAVAARYGRAGVDARADSSLETIAPAVVRIGACRHQNGL